MKRFFSRLCRFFWSWRFLKFILWTATIIVLFYAEEDWRGARAWAATKAKWEARGESFDFNRLIPPPVPDAQNLAALPLFKMEIDPRSNGNLEPLALLRALRKDQPGNALPVGGLGSAATGEPPDLKKIRTSVAAAYAEAFKTAPATNKPLAQFEALYPFIAELRAAAAALPYCHFEQNYLDPPYHLDIALITSQIQVSRILTLHAILALDAHQPAVALGDIHANLQLAAGLRAQPILVSGLVAIGVTALTLPAVNDGLARHAWSDDQLVELENELGQADFLADYQRCLRGEAIGMMLPSLENFRNWRVASSDHAASNSSFPGLDDLGGALWANGWIDQLKVQAIDFDLGAVRFIDPKSRTVDAQAVNVFTDELGHRRHVRSLAGALAEIAAGPVGAAVEKFAQAQVDLDEARIACAVERYQLMHGAFPGTLDLLVPACISVLPHDVMNGQPYHYRPLTDGGYLLYSVGWNQKDDGGKVVYGDASTFRSIDYLQGDWPWVVPK